MTEGLDTAIIATVGGLVTMLTTKFVDVLIDRRTNWRREAQALRHKQEQDMAELRARLEQCEQQRVEHERRINELLNKLGFFEYRVQAQDHEIARLTALLTQHRDHDK